MAAAGVEERRELCASSQADEWQQLAPVSFDSVPWSETSSMRWCHGGSGGAFVVRLHGGAVCVKGSAWSPGEVFAAQLAGALNVPTAKLRVVHPGDPEILAIRAALSDAEAEESHRLQAGLLRSVASLTVVEYVDGVTMMGVAAHEFLKSLESGSALWFELGRLMAFDMLINNFDRLPLAWSNEGNLGNIMLGSRRGAVLGIDQSVQPILHPAGLESYLSRVGRVVEELRHGGPPGKALGAVRTAICNNTAVDLDDAQLLAMRDGCQALLVQLAELRANGGLLAVLEAVTADVDAAAKNAPPASLGSHGTAQLFCEFVGSVAAVMTERLGCSATATSLGGA